MSSNVGAGTAGMFGPRSLKWLTLGGFWSAASYAGVGGCHGHMRSSGCVPFLQAVGRTIYKCSGHRDHIISKAGPSAIQSSASNSFLSIDRLSRTDKTLKEGHLPHEGTRMSPILTPVSACGTRIGRRSCAQAQFRRVSNRAHLEGWPPRHLCSAAVSSEHLGHWTFDHVAAIRGGHRTLQIQPQEGGFICPSREH